MYFFSRDLKCLRLIRLSVTCYYRKTVAVLLVPFWLNYSVDSIQESYKGITPAMCWFNYYFIEMVFWDYLHFLAAHSLSLHPNSREIK